MMLSRRFQRLVRGGITPNLVVAQRVIDKMAAAATKHIEDETGEAMIGFVVPPALPNGVATIYVLDTIAPDSTAVREFYTFQQGDDMQGDIFQWLYNNWEAQRQKANSGLGKLLGGKWDVPLMHVGDWHKQPGYMIQPSGGDLMTALHYLDDSGVDFLLAPILTLGHPTTIGEADAVVNFLLEPRGDDTAMRVDFWYIDDRTPMFVPITPTLYPDDQLPTLASYPWHLLREPLAREEFGLIQDDGVAISLTHWDADGDLPLEVCLLTMRAGADKLVIIVTPHDFPQHPASARVSPAVPMGADDDLQDVFEKAWAKAQPVDVAYDATHHPTLLAYLHAVEDKVGIQRAAPAAEIVTPEAAKAVETAPVVEAKAGEAKAATVTKQEAEVVKDDA
jgi:hypothetical protein